MDPLSSFLTFLKAIVSEQSRYLSELGTRHPLAARLLLFGYLVILTIIMLIAIAVVHRLTSDGSYPFFTYLVAIPLFLVVMLGIFLLFDFLSKPRRSRRQPAKAQTPAPEVPESRGPLQAARRFLAGVVLTMFIGATVATAIITIMASGGIACFMLFKVTCEPPVRYEITGEMTPVYLGEVSRNAPVSDTVHFSYRRGSCSDTSKGEFLACLPEGATVDSAVIRNAGGRNWGIFDRQGVEWQPGSGEDTTPFTNDVPDRPNCKAIRWKATSGGRTGIGECRYHGTIAFDVELAGTITRTEPGEVQGATETFENLPIARGLFEAGLSEDSPDQPVYTYRGTHPFPQILRWHYAATVDKRPRILGLLPGFTRTVSSETPGDGCVTSGLSDVGGLRIVEDC